MRLCTFCGQQNRNDGKFCTHCGSGLAMDSYVVGRLVVLGEGSERGNYLISSVERVLGRDAGNDVSLDDDEASARHARISFDDEGFWIEDLDTTNGTFVNGQRITERTVLRNEDLIRIGRTMLQFHV